MSERSPLYDSTAAAGAEFGDEAGWQMPLNYDDMPDEYHRARATAALFDRSHHGKIAVSGPDAATFLHNLCTNDIKSLTPGSGCEAFLTNAKAKVIAHLAVFREGEQTFWLDTGPGGGDRVFKHLDRHLISEQLELMDRTRELAQVHVVGLKAREVLGQTLGTAIPELEFGNLMSSPADARPPLAIRKRSALGVSGYDIVCPCNEAEGIWKALVQAGAAPAGSEAYEILRVEAGIPRYGVDMDEERFAVEVNRTQQAICYTKGCYLGQEPIVMARDRGHVNRLLLGLKIADPLGVPTAARVFRDGTEVGAVTSTVVSPRLGAIALAYLRRGNWEPGTSVQVQADSEMRRASVVALPFEAA